eukprot:scaffold279743_cov32-Tisochrysis_lutea.AAC.1
MHAFRKTRLFSLLGPTRGVALRARLTATAPAWRSLLQQKDSFGLAAVPHRSGSAWCSHWPLRLLRWF